jgi:hypothetical protein
MAWCCPPARGCNSAEHDEPCAVALLRAVAEEEPKAQVALERWDELERVRDERKATRRFRRRAYARARERALVALAMRTEPQDGAAAPRRRGAGFRLRGGRRRATDLARRR